MDRAGVRGVKKSQCHNGGTAVPDPGAGSSRSSVADIAANGVAAMKPMTLREIAEAIEMHESTISRVTSNKYVLCDRGLFELKYFFGSGVASTGEGEGAAAEAVKAAIGEIIDNEVEILSDDAIAGLLKQRGFDCARRTVVKYRESMGLGSSVQRRRRRKIAGAA